MTHKLTLQAIEPVTHNVNHLVFDRPAGYEFAPGQATDFALDRDGWREEQRPFTFCNLPGSDTLEFVIKSYPSHDGVTEQIAKLQPGDTVLIEDAWGAIEDKGPGTFIAGGAGITPFIAILRARLDREGTLDGSQLIFSNTEARDIILREEWERMPGLDTTFTLTGEDAPGLPHARIDAGFLDRTVKDWSGMFYVCGPDKMVEDIAGLLRDKDVPAARIVSEEARGGPRPGVLVKRAGND
ncbi:flavodoxin reductase [Psychromarinibacter sp. C21-152]|uniref:Flavodoxin reductase n=1 Tax=Psychromarinibacter sediminicola TaxID=3033385 RepID=A0AAE3T7H4_9RHOB|nr:flavodoxin reductase [Psychromarinibacter sediminicola]MDF0600320.1 flavodoxin reductase [Psychromarinibacter sediminicola]